MNIKILNKGFIFILILFIQSDFTLSQNKITKYSEKWKSYEPYSGEIDILDRDSIIIYSFDCCYLQISKTTNNQDLFSFIFDKGLVSPQMLNHPLDKYYVENTTKCRCDSSDLDLNTKSNNLITIHEIKKLYFNESDTIQLDINLSIKWTALYGEHYFAELIKKGDRYYVRKFGYYYSDI